MRITTAMPNSAVEIAAIASRIRDAPARRRAASASPMAAARSKMRK